MSERQHTRAVVMVHSHVENEDGGKYDLSRDVVSINTNKTIKGVGQFNFVLLPRRNYLNLLFPNDVVNIYFDPGDGKRGFVRTMLGYIDRIERTENVDSNGAMSTVFTISGSDFTKAIDTTEIVFNPALAAKQEFVDERFGLSNLFGDALRTRGIIIHGTPAEFVENILSLLMGFGTQWVLPKSYPTTNALLDKSRSQRLQRYKNHIPTAVQTALKAQYGINVTTPALNNTELQQSLDKLNKKLNELGNKLQLQDPDALTSLKNANISLVYYHQLELQAYQTLIKETNTKSPAGILDLLSFDFIETQCIDGFVQSEGLWQQEGTVSSIVYGQCNEMVNELMFDLRPVAFSSDDFCFGVDPTQGTAYSYESDELGINAIGTDLFQASTAAIRYAPAVIFRENPHSVVDGLDLTKFNVMGTNVGLVEFGPIFSADPNTPGRKIIALRNPLTPEPDQYQNGKPYKHIDVVIITNTDVTHSQLGRSDAQVYNFSEMYSSGIGGGSTSKESLADFSPLLTPVSIFRHGLRRWNKTTNYANYGHNLVSNDPNAASDQSLGRTNLVRWILLHDHWNQHNIEYLSGTINLRAMPEIRVGYRLDWEGRNESYYVDSVSHQWEYPGTLRTSIQVTRGQRNDPFPAYIPPVFGKNNVTGFPAGTDVTSIPVSSNIPTGSLEFANSVASSVAIQGGGNRQTDGRLGKFFHIKDTRATANAVGAVNKNHENNTIDQFPHADHGGRAEYSSGSMYRDTSSAEEQLNDSNRIPDGVGK